MSKNAANARCTILRDGQPIESALRRFKRLIEKSGVLSDAKLKRYFLTGTEKTKNRKKAQVANNRKQQRELISRTRADSHLGLKIHKKKKRR